MRVILLICFLSVGIHFVGRAQNIPDSLLLSVNQRLSHYPAEHIYIQTSKNIYETGEDLWFKAWQLDARTFGLSALSQTLYVQLINKQDSIVWREKYLIEDGIVDGHIYIDEKLPAGDYFLEAYSRHSFYNDSTGNLSTRKIRIVDNIAHYSPYTHSVTNENLRFDVFPEGGNSVAGLPCRFAFKATNGKGYPVDVEGWLLQDKDTVVNLKSIHDGMGKFSFIPLVDKTYRIELKQGGTYPLTEIHTQGMTLNLSKQDDTHLEFIISQTDGLSEQEIYLLGQLRGVICCAAIGRLKDNLKIKMPLTEFPYQGIAEFTLFDSSMLPVAERLVFVHPQKKLNISVKPEKDRYRIRQKATLKINVKDENGNPVKANLGISVFDAAYLASADGINIVNHCYLSSQIRGKIYNPAYYFDEANKNREQALDLLLLTQGWRRYVRSANGDINHGEAFLPDEIQGTQHLKHKKNSKALQGSEQLIQVTGANGNANFVWVDSTGYFRVDTEIMKELQGGYLYLKPMLSNQYKPEIVIEDYFPVINELRKKKTNNYPIERIIPQDESNIPDEPIVSYDNTIMLQEVTITRKAHRPFRDKFMGRLDSLAQIGGDMPWVSPEGHLENYKPGYTIHHDPNVCPTPDIVPLEKRSKPVEGKTYYIMKPKYYGTGGAFTVEDAQYVVYKAPVFSEEELLKKNNLWRTKGYYATREFYQPDDIDMLSSIPDARNTLLWQPSVITDENGEATVSFYCSDINTKFIIIAEGVDGSGLLGTAKSEFRVNR